MSVYGGRQQTAVIGRLAPGRLPLSTSREWSRRTGSGRRPVRCRQVTWDDTAAPNGSDGRRGTPACLSAVRVCRAAGDYRHHYTAAPSLRPGPCPAVSSAAAGAAAWRPAGTLAGGRRRGAGSLGAAVTGEGCASRVVPRVRRVGLETQPRASVGHSAAAVRSAAAQRLVELCDMLSTVGGGF